MLVLCHDGWVLKIAEVGSGIMIIMKSISKCCY
jgi:hypothetical protein